MKTKITNAFEQIKTKSKIDVCIARVNTLLMAAHSLGQLDEIIDVFDSALNTALYSIKDESEEPAE